MSKIIGRWYAGVVFPFVFAAGFFISVICVNAGETVGTEGAFFHTHGSSCYEDITLSCESEHVEKVEVEQSVYNCLTCGGDTGHHVVVHNWRCPRTGVKWQTDCYTACNTCGTIHSIWSQGMPGNHQYTAKRLKCILQENEKTATVQIVADDTWTNQGVVLKTNINILKQDLSSSAIGLDWAEGTLLVTENGSYSVTATNGQGTKAVSTMQVSCIDKIPPVINSISGDEVTMTDTCITVTVSVSDGESGLADAACSLDGGGTWCSTTSFAVTEGQSVQFVVRDKAGNQCTRTILRNQFPYPPKPVPSVATETLSPVITQPSSYGGQNEEGQVTGVQNVGAPGVETQQSTEPMNTQTDEEKDVFADSPGRVVEDGKAEEADRKLKKELTVEEQRQAKGISGIMQCRARDAFFTERQIKKSDSPPEAGDEEEDFRHPGGSSEEAEGDLTTILVNSVEEQAVPLHGFFGHVQKNANAYLATLIGVFLISTFFYLLWLHSAVLYCYEGGEEYRKLGCFRLKRRKDELELYLPDYLLQSTKALRYRLMLRGRMVKMCKNHDLVVYNEDNKLRQQVEECVDFIL